MKHVLTKTSLTGNSSIALEGGSPFVGIGAETGVFLGVLYKNVDVLEKKDTDLIVMPLISICESGMQANKMFENLKKDKMRFNKLAAEIQKQKVMDRSELQQFISNSLDDSETLESNSMEQNKRLAFNNGIFKANDNWNNN